MKTRADQSLLILGLVACMLMVTTCKGDDGPTGLMGTDGAPGTPGTPGAPGTARAYALVNPFGLTIVAAKSRNFVSVRRPVTGVYCVTPAAGISPANSAAFVTVEWGNSGGIDLLAFNVDANTTDCTAAEFDVRTYTGSPPVLGNNVAFQILIP